MTDHEFRQQLTRKLDAFHRLVNASMKAEDDKQARYALIQTAYEALGEFLEKALGEDDKPTKDQADQGTEKTDQAQTVSAWSTIKRRPQAGLNLGTGRTNKADASAWGSIQRVVPRNLDMGRDDTVKSESASAWSTIRRRKASGLEL